MSFMNDETDHTNLMTKLHKEAVQRRLVMIGNMLHLQAIQI